MTPNNPHPGAAPASRPRFNPWPYGIIAAFAVFISGITALVVAASSGANELVARDYYEQELRYQTRVDQLQRTLVWSNRIQAAFDAQARRITVSIPSEHAAAGAAGRVHLYRPSEARADHAVDLATAPDGTQSLDASRLSPGLWKVKLEWKVGADDFYAARSVVVPAEPGR